MSTLLPIRIIPTDLTARHLRRARVISARLGRLIAQRRPIRIRRCGVRMGRRFVRIDRRSRIRVRRRRIPVMRRWQRRRAVAVLVGRIRDGRHGHIAPGVVKVRGRLMRRQRIRVDLGLDVSRVFRLALPEFATGGASCVAVVGAGTEGSLLAVVADEGELDEDGEEEEDAGDFNE